MGQRLDFQTGFAKEQRLVELKETPRELHWAYQTEMPTGYLTEQMKEQTKVRSRVARKLQVFENFVQRVELLLLDLPGDQRQIPSLGQSSFSPNVIWIFLLNSCDSDCCACFLQLLAY